MFSFRFSDSAISIGAESEARRHNANEIRLLPPAPGGFAVAPNSLATGQEDDDQVEHEMREREGVVVHRTPFL